MNFLDKDIFYCVRLKFIQEAKKWKNYSNYSKTTKGKKTFLDKTRIVSKKIKKYILSHVQKH